MFHDYIFDFNLNVACDLACFLDTVAIWEQYVRWRLKPDSTGTT